MAYTDIPEGFTILEEDAPSSTPVTFYSLGTKAGGTDETNDYWTNKGYTSTGKNLTPGVVAVNTKVYPLGTVFEDADSGAKFIAADRHGNRNPNVVDIYVPPDQYGSVKGINARNLRPIGRVDKVGKTAEEIQKQLADFGAPAVQEVEQQPIEIGGNSPAPMADGGGNPAPAYADIPEGFTVIEEPAQSPQSNTSYSDIPEGYTLLSEEPQAPVLENKTASPYATTEQTILQSQKGLSQDQLRDAISKLTPEQQKGVNVSFDPNTQTWTLDVVGQTPVKPGVGEGVVQGLTAAGARTAGGVADIAGQHEFGGEMNQLSQGLSQNFSQSTPGRVGGAIGQTVPMVTGGMANVVTQAATQAFGETYQQTGNYTQAVTSALKTAPEMAAYWLIGGGAAKAASPLLRDFGPIAKGAAGSIVATLANMVTSSGIRAANAPSGQRLSAAKPTLESTIQDGLFGIFGGAHAGMEAARTESGVREGLTTAPQWALETAAADPEFRKTSPYNPQLIDAELQRRQGHPPSELPPYSPEVDAIQSEIQQKAAQIAPQAPEAVQGAATTETPVQAEIEADKPQVTEGSEQRAIPQQIPNEEVLRNEGQGASENVELSRVGERNAQPEEPAQQGQAKEEVAAYSPEDKTAPQETSEPEPTSPWTTSTEFKEEPEAQRIPTPSEQSSLSLVPPGAGALHQTFVKMGNAIKQSWNFARSLPAQSDFKTALLRWTGRNQKSTWEIGNVMREINKGIPKSLRRDAITNYIQANGDIVELQRRAAATPNAKLKDGYLAATNLTPKEKAIADQVRSTYDILLKRAQKYGINVRELPNYVNQIWKKPISKSITTSSHRLNEFFRFSKERFYDSFFEGEQAGLSPQTKDIGKLLPIYMNELNNAINSRRFVEEMSKGTMPDGRPILAPRGGMSEVADAKGKAYLVFPDKVSENTADYKVVDQPALHDWVWKGKDENGNPIFVKSDLAVHPQAYGHLKNVLGNSVFKEWWNNESANPAVNALKKGAKGLETLQSYAKGTMLSLSPFHQVQEGIHALGHKVSPFSIPKIDLSKPEQMDAVNHGLMLQHDRLSQSQFMEGMSSDRNLVTKTMRRVGGKPGELAANALDGYTHWLFEKYIPGLKLKTYDAMVQRNTKRYAKELASGAVTQAQVKNLSAQQANAAYGHLNYAEIGRNPTFQHMMQAFMLAPDFLEARTRFALQAAKGLTGSKTGMEQLSALALLAATQYVAARISNKLDHDDYEWDHPFEFLHNNKAYGVRSVPEDIYKLFSDPRRFTYGRLSPLLGKGVVEGLSGVNYRGEKTTLGETAKNMLAGTVPLPLQSLTRDWTRTTQSNPISPFEQLLSSTGVVVHRYSPITETYKNAHEWIQSLDEKDAAKLGLDQREAVYPQSKYTQLRYALEDGDNAKAKEEINKLLEKGMDRKAITKGFELSINHHFTGSKRGDEAFLKSLDEKDKKRFEAALKRRKLMLQRFKQVD